MKKTGPVNLARKLTSVKLPAKVYFVDTVNDRIIELSGLKQSDTAGKCGCNEIDGSYEVSDGKDVYRNDFTISMSLCYLRLKDAIEFLDLHKLRAQKRIFIQRESGYRSSRSSQILLMKGYPKIVLDHLRKEYKIEDDNPVTVDTLKQSHFRLVFDNDGFSEVLKQIVDIRFPSLVGDGDSDD